MTGIVQSAKNAKKIEDIILYGKESQSSEAERTKEIIRVQYDNQITKNKQHAFSSGHLSPCLLPGIFLIS